MPTPRETILSALHARLSALPATALRGDVLPERVPTAGLVILGDGEPGERFCQRVVWPKVRSQLRLSNGTPAIAINGDDVES